MATVCCTCKVEPPLSYNARCRKCLRDYNRAWSRANPDRVREINRKQHKKHPWHKTNPEASKRQALAWARTKRGKLSRTYNDMRYRVEGKAPKSDPYKGLPLLSKDDFMAWGMADPEFNRLHKEWVAAGYRRKLSPSIDRIEGPKGYVLGNMQWLTMAANAAKGGRLSRPTCECGECSKCKKREYMRRYLAKHPEQRRKAAAHKRAKRAAA